MKLINGTDLVTSFAFNLRRRPVPTLIACDLAHSHCVYITRPPSWNADQSAQNSSTFVRRLSVFLSRRFSRKWRKKCSRRREHIPDLAPQISLSAAKVMQREDNLAFCFFSQIKCLTFWCAAFLFQRYIKS